MRTTSRLSKAILAVSLLFCLTASSAHAAEAEETHLLNEALSLTGNCSKGTLDTIEDPGCPGGAHPSEPLAFPSGVATDPRGDIYVSSQGPLGTGAVSNRDKGHIDVFDPAGHYLTELATPGVEAIAVDASGNLYASTYCPSGSNLACAEAGGAHFLRFDPTKYVPAAGEISYGAPPVELPVRGGPGAGHNPQDLAVNPANQHLFASYQDEIQEFGPAISGEPNAMLEKGIGASVVGYPGEGSIALDQAHGLLYFTTREGEETPGIVRVLELAAPHTLVRTIDGSTTPEGSFFSSYLGFGVTAEEATGDIFVGDFGAHKVYELEEDGSYLETFKHGFESERGFLHVDNSPESPNQGYLFVPAGYANPGHLFAYQPKPEIQPPAVESTSTSGVGQREAVLRAKVNPEAFETHYTFEYITKAAFEAEGFEGALLGGEGDLPPGVSGIDVSTPVSGLTPGTAYRFRVRAESQCEPGGCVGEGQGTFTTFEATQQGGNCENAALRSGPSASLPDCRAYELVTPSDTNGHSPQGPGSGAGPNFGTPTMSATGDALAFRVEGGPIPGTDGAGGFNGDAYLATRTPSGWDTILQGPSGEENPFPSAGGLSPDLSYISWSWGGSLVKNETPTYIRYPDGSFHLLGEGALGTDTHPELHYIAPHGSHIIFSSDVQLSEGAPAAPTKAIYDRTADGALHVVSLLPGEAVPGAGEDASFLGRSDNGSSVAFKVGNVLYLRREDSQSLEAAPQALSGHQLSCDAGNELAGATPSYEWLLDGTPIPGATASIYTPIPSDGGSLVQCLVRAEGAEGGSLGATAPLLVDHARPGGAPRPPAKGLAPLPTPTVGQSLQCEPGSWGGSPSLAYQWLRNAGPISGAESSSYEVQAADEHALLQCEVTGEANGAKALALTAPVEVSPPPKLLAAPSIANTSSPGKAPVQGNHLSCEGGKWENQASLGFKWLRNGAPISAATASTHTVVAADNGTVLQCEETATNPTATALALSSAVAVSPLLQGEVPSGSVSLTGTPTVGATRKCEAGEWKNSPSFSYRWLRNGAPIPGASEAEYTLQGEDLNKTVYCELTATNEKGAVLALSGGFVGEGPVVRASGSSLQAAFAGFSAEGSRLFYVLGGDLFAYEPATEQTVAIAESGDVEPVNIPASGEGAYFISESKELAGEPNPNGAEAIAGQPNLFYWDGAQVRFVATITAEDLEGELTEFTGTPSLTGGFVEWMKRIAKAEYGLDPTRSSREGSALLFRARAKLTPYDNKGHAEIYRYDAGEGSLVCISCDPTGSAPESEAKLATIEKETILSPHVQTANLSEDGKRAFFESSERLVPSDNDGTQDVYEWEAEGEGSCRQAGGCLFLISSGQSARPSYFYGASSSGNDVAFSTSDLLSEADHDETPSLYDARVEGGFPAASAGAGECLGEACQPAASPPAEVTPASSSFKGAGNVREDAKHKKRKRHHAKKHAKRHHKAKSHRHGRAGR